MAAKFRKVDPRIWTDESFVKLNAEEKLLALWLITSSRTNRCGIVMWSASLASEETGIPRDRIDTVLDTVCHTVSWTVDTPARLVFLARWWKYNRPDNESALKGAMADLWDVPRNNLKCCLKRSKVDLPEYLHTVYDTVLDTVYDTVYDTVSPQEKEKEKETEKEKDTQRRFVDTNIQNGVIRHEAAFAATQFKDKFDSLVATHPIKTPPKHAEIEWRIVATDLSVAEKIVASHQAWVKTTRWKRGVGIPNLSTFLHDRWFDNTPEPEKDEKNEKRKERTAGRYDPAVHG